MRNEIATGYAEIKANDPAAMHSYVKWIISTIYPLGGDVKVFLEVAKTKVPSDYANSAEFVADFAIAYDEFFGIENSTDEFDYTDYSMRQGELGR
jgi:hypothetical protein